MAFVLVFELGWRTSITSGDCCYPLGFVPGMQGMRYPGCPASPRGRVVRLGQTGDCRARSRRLFSLLILARCQRSLLPAVSPLEITALVCGVSAELGQWALLVAMLPVKPPGHQSLASAAALEKAVSPVCLLRIFKCRHDLNLQHGERKREGKNISEGF